MYIRPIWPTRSLRELVSFAGGYGFPERFQGRIDGELPFFKVSDMNTAGNERALWRANHYVTRDLAARQSWHPMPVDAVVFAKVGAALLLNRRRLLSQDSLIDNNMLAAVASTEINPTWLYWWLQAIDFGMFVQPGAVPSVNQGQLGSLSVSLPHPSEQRRIAEVLDTLDDTIRKTEQLIAKLKQVKQGLLHDLLTRGIDDNGELRDSSRHPEQFKDSSLGRIPAHWEVSSVDSEFEITAGIALGPHRRPSHRPWPYLRVANVHRDALELFDVAQMEILPGELSERRIALGDLLVVEGHANPAEIGRCAMSTAEVVGYTFQNHLFRLRAKRMLPAFCLRWLNSSRTQEYWRRECATSSGLNTINRTKLRRLEVLVPPMAEQQFIVDRLEAIAARLHGEQSAIEKLRLMKRGLMDDLLTGRVRVTTLLDEAAT